MRKLYFLVPGTTGQFYGGGLFAELRTMEMAQKLCPTQVVTYRQREESVPFLTDLLQNEIPGQAIFVMGWGFDLPKILKQLQGHHLLYHAHTSGYGFRVPPQVPILTVSRNTLGYWGQQASNGLIYCLPNAIAPEFTNHQGPRDIDILVQVRKSSRYLIQTLVPALQQRHKVTLLNGFVEDIAALFNRTKIYLYDSAEYWAVHGVTEGFGLPPLEAMACGCQVFSSVNHGLSDFLDPGFNSHKIAGYSLEYDLQRIAHVLDSPPRSIPPALIEQFRAEALIPRFQVILGELNAFFDHVEKYPSTIAGLGPWQLRQAQARTLWQKVQKKLKR